MRNISRCATVPKYWIYGLTRHHSFQLEIPKAGVHSNQTEIRSAVDTVGIGDSCLAQPDRRWGSVMSRLNLVASVSRGAQLRTFPKSTRNFFGRDLTFTSCLAQVRRGNSQ